MRILITGAAGMLGTDLWKALGSEHELILTDVVGDFLALDVTDTQAVSDMVTGTKPEAVIHAAAFTNVDGCEVDPDTAFRVNAFGTWNVASACAANDVALLYVSTDFVFDGEKSEPYYEFDLPNPLSRYGASKLAGEWYVRNICHKHWIVRTAWLFGENGNSFPRTVIDIARTGKPLRVVADQVGSPTFTRDLSLKIEEILTDSLYGTYHVTNKGACSWYEFARTALDLAGLGGVDIMPIKSDEWDSPTRRPKNSVLRHWALEVQGMDDLRQWQDALADFVSRLG